MLRAQIYTSQAGVNVHAIEFSGFNGATIAEWAGGYHFLPEPYAKDSVWPEYVEVPSFHGMRMKAYKKDMVLKAEGDDIWYVLPKEQFLDFYAATGVWETFK